MNAARLRAGQPQAHAQRGGFASAIGANHAQAFAGGDLEGHVIDDGGITVALDKVFAFEEWVHVRILPKLLDRRKI